MLIRQKEKKLKVTSGVHCHPSNSNLANICFCLWSSCVPRNILVAGNSATQLIQQCLVLYNQHVAIMLLIKQLQMLVLQVERLLASHMLMLKSALFYSWLPLACAAPSGYFQLLHTHCIFWPTWIWLRYHSGLAPSVFRTEARGSEEWRETAGGESSGAGKGSNARKYYF